MNQFWKFLFASCLGTALALILLTFIGFGALAGIAGSASQSEKVRIEPNSVLDLTFEQAAIPEKTNNLEMDPFDVKQKDVLGLTDMVKAIETAKSDNDIKGIYINAMTVPAGKATASVLRAALLDFKSSGKFIVAYAPVYSQGAYYMASVADTVLLNPIGSVDFRGLSSTIAYYKGMLDKLDVDMKIFYAGKFKSATEPLRYEKMSEENRLQVREYLNALNDIYMRDVAASRNIPEADLRLSADAFDGRNAEGALRSRLVDRICYEDEAFASMKKLMGLGAKDKLKRVSVGDYFGAKVKKTDFKSKDKIAVVYAEGGISDGKKASPGEIIDGDYVKILRKIRQDDKFKAIVLRINSPGGSVLASENILREVQLCQAAGIPVVVSMGDVAASGGYYIACQADSIFAEPNTITGSIGVFGVIPMFDRTMRENLGVTFDTVRTGKHSAFGTPFIPFSKDEDAMIQQEIDRIYADFLQKVAKGRDKTPEQINEIAQGRVWPGAKAKELGLVDELGGLDRALQSAAALAKIDKYRVTEYPQTKKGFERLLEELTSDSKDEDAVLSRMARSELGDLYPIYRQLRDIRRSAGVQAKLPYELFIQ
ncbi:MAG: signal peptide peptidase SppA [Saprospiraceae bacterium]